MAATDWNWRAPAELQDYSWDCSAASTAWALQAAGRPYTEDEVIAGLGPGRISPALGLLDASGAGIVEWLAEIGVVAHNTSYATWADLESCAGFQPTICGGRAWYHWVGVRMGGTCAGYGDLGNVLLANPSPGWMEIGQYIDRTDFANLGEFAVVWFEAW